MIKTYNLAVISELSPSHVQTVAATNQLRLSHHNSIANYVNRIKVMLI